MDSVRGDPVVPGGSHPSLERVLDRLGAVGLVDHRGRYRYVTHEACLLANYGREELLALDTAGLFPEIRATRISALCRDVRAHGPRNLEGHLRTRDGRLLPVELHVRPFEIEGEPLLLCFVRELSGHAAAPRQRAPLRAVAAEAVTGRCQQKPSLTAWERAFRTLAENLPENIARYDKSGRVVYVNRTPCDALREALEQLIAPGFDGAPARIFKERCTKAKVGDTPEEMKISIRNAAGEDRIHLVRFVTERGEDGEVAGMLAIGRDITELERTTALLHERTEAFRALVEHSPDAIARFDRNGRRVYANRGDGGRVGVVSDPLFDEDGALFHLSACLPKIVQKVLRSGKMFEGEVPYSTPAGEKRWAHLRVVPEFGADGSVVSALAIGHDTTPGKVKEQRLKASPAEARELAAMRENAREEERKRLARELHDELGQSLTALRLEISIAGKRLPDSAGEEKARIGRILSLLDKTSGVIKDVIAALRPAALDGGLAIAMEWLTTDFARRTGMACTLELHDGEIELGEPGAVALFRILQEALTNVARHARATRVRVRLERSGLDYRLSVCDDGVGFEPSLRRKKSFGLVGMRERALAVGGMLAVSSAPGHGTDVVVLIPVGRECRS